MSWDINLEINTGKKFVEVTEERNITFNVSPMYYKAIKLEDGVRGLHKMSATKAIPILKNAINDMIQNSEEYKQLNPKNGWGNYEYALEILQWLLKKCDDNPMCRIRIV